VATRSAAAVSLALFCGLAPLMLHLADSI
jgi:hypothetical protein